MRDRERAKVWWSIFTSIFCTVAVVIAGVIYTNQVDQESNRRWCGVVLTLDDAYNQPGTRPQTQIGIDLAREIHQLTEDFGCQR